MHLVWYEWKKIWQQRGVFAVLILFIALNFYGLWKEAPVKRDAVSQGRTSIYRQIEGAMTDESVTFVMNEYARLNEKVMVSWGTNETGDAYYTKSLQEDYEVFEELRNEMMRQYAYAETTENIVKLAEENVAYLNDASFESQRNALIARTYKNRVSQYIYDFTGFAAYLEYDFSVLLVLLFSLFTVTPIFCGEKECGMALILQSSSAGHCRLPWAKLIVSVCLSVLIGCLFFSMDYLYFALSSQLHGAQAPLYAIASFAFTPLSLSIAQYVLLHGFTKLFGCVVLMLLFVAVSALTRDSVTAFVLNIGALIGSLLLGDALPLVNPVPLLEFDQLVCQLEVTRVGQWPFYTALLQAICALGLAVVLVFFIFRMQRLRSNVSITAPVQKLFLKRRGNP